MELSRRLFAGCLSVFLGLHGARSGSLSFSGALTACLAGYLTLGVPDSNLFGVLLVAFYLAGSRVTKIKAAYKATLEEEEHHSAAGKANAKPGGNRNAVQVLCNCYVGTICAVAWQMLCASKTGWAYSRWCILDTRHDYSRQLVLATLSFFSACAGDTFASELGILSRGEPVLVTTWKRVPRGTNGGISAWGILMSILGGTYVGLVSIACLAVENKACRLSKEGPLLLIVGAGSGALGSLIDSILGATCQPSYYSTSKKKIVSRPERGAKLIAGRSMLSNNAVNFISSGLVAILVGCCSSFT